MKPAVLEPTSAAKAGWVIILLTMGWLVFLLWPYPAEEPAAKPAAIPLPTSSLTRAGLRDYTDWEGLPEIFAIWADKAEWKNGRTRFAYWHPVMKTYSYYFEAVRVGAGYRFKEIPEPHDTDHFWDESLGEDCPIRFYLSYAVGKQEAFGPLRPPAPPAMDGMKAENTRVKIPVTGAKITPINPTPKP